MTHPITPPAELVQQWAKSSPIQHSDESWAYELFIAHHTAQWGADQELEACCEWVEKTIPSWAPNTLNEQLRAARRPNPPSLKEQGLVALKLLKQRTTDPNIIEPLTRALEALPNEAGT
jgi:hypothetical protein